MSTEPDALHGVTLEQYAGLTAVLAEALDLDAALANEGLSAADFRPADAAWKARLAEDGPVLDAYRAKRAEAEDWLGRPVQPIDEDLRAWVDFLRAYAAHPAPFELLADAGLGVSDLARLQRRWARRLDADEKLAKQAAEIAKEKPGKLPPITPGAAALKPFPWSRGRAAAATAPGATEAPTTASGGGELPLDVYAAVCAELAEPGAAAAAVLARHGLDAAAFAALDATWRQRLATDAALERDYRRLFDHQRARLRAAARDPAAGAPAAIAPVFVAAPVMEMVPAFVPEPHAGPHRLAGTALALDVPHGPALPFVEGEAPPEIAEPSNDPSPKPAKGLGGTALAVDVPRGPALPFAGAEKPAKPASPLGGTALALDVPHEPALPFIEGSAPPEITEPSNEPPPKPANGLGGTALALDVPHGPALPFAPEGDAPAAKKPNKLASARVFDVARILATAPAEPPPLTIEQYASLRVELDLAPDRAAETLARYRLSPAQREAVDRHFQDRFAREPALREAWEGACRTYRAWLATQGKR